jgi:hypothetical protein
MPLYAALLRVRSVSSRGAQKEASTTGAGHTRHTGSWAPVCLDMPNSRSRDHKLARDRRRWRAVYLCPLFSLERNRAGSNVERHTEIAGLISLETHASPSPITHFDVEL